MAETKVDTAGLEKLGALLAAAPEIAEEEISRALQEAGDYLVGEIADRTPVDQAELARSWLAEDPIKGPFGLSTLIGTSLDYAAAVEDGSKPHMPPVEPLVFWAEHRLGLSGDEAKAAAQAIAWKIKHHGTKGKHMVKDALHDGAPTLEAIFNAAAVRIVERMEGND